MNVIVMRISRLRRPYGTQENYWFRQPRVETRG
jgi:hypothetical protein